MPLVFIFLGLTFLALLFYGKTKVLSINKFFLLTTTFACLLSFFTQPWLLTSNLQINSLVFISFILLIAYFCLVYPHDLINKSLIVNTLVTVFYILLIKIDNFFLLSFNIMPATLLVASSNIIAFKTYEQVFFSSVFAFFILEIYNSFYLLRQFTFASTFSPIAILYPLAISLIVNFSIIAFLNVIKKYPRRLKCEN